MQIEKHRVFIDMLYFARLTVNWSKEKKLVEKYRKEKCRRKKYRMEKYRREKCKRGKISKLKIMRKREIVAN
jgi:hypothetical protein